jgi:hypothetical protein
MALENFDHSVLCDNGTGLGILYYLETDTSRSEMVGLQKRE